jgi:hypothetical protein
MKYGFGLLLVCIVSVAGVATLLLGIDLVRPFRSANVVAQPEPPLEPSSTAKATPVAKPARSRVPQTRAVIEPATGDAIAARGQTPAATQKETTAKTYGDAALSITRLDRGHDLETLVYTRNRGKEITLLSLEDGKVSGHSPSGITPAVDSPGPRPDERPTDPKPAATAIPPAAEVPKTIPKLLDQTLAEGPKATKPPGLQPAKGNVGTCGEYRDGKLTVKPCSQVPLSTNEWLAKGAGAAPNESAPAGNRH